MSEKYKEHYQYWNSSITKGTVLNTENKIVCKNCGCVMTLPRIRDGKTYCANCGKEIKKG